RLLHIRLVEGIHAQDRAPDSRRELPAEELLPQLVGVLEPELGHLGVLGALAARRDEPFAVLSRRFREQLLDPQAEVARDEHLVAPVLPVPPEREAQLETRIARSEEHTSELQ